MFLVALVSSFIGTSHSAQSKPPRKKNLNSPLRLVAKAKSGTDYNKNQYTSYSWYIKNIGARNVWLPLPKDRFQSKSTPPRYFQFRTRVSGSWSSTKPGVHEIDYEADWIVLQPGEGRQLFTTTFSEEGDSFEAIEVSVIYRDDRGKIHKEKLSWLKSHRLR